MSAQLTLQSPAARISSFRPFGSVRRCGPTPLQSVVRPVPKKARLRLTRRGRLLLIGLPLMFLAGSLLTLAGFFTAPVMASGAGQAPGVQTATVTVAPGETLWSLATELAPHRDPREVVAEIVELNGLSSSLLTAGQPLAVPAAP
jgi:hypothetical protein